jgi:hypothetical protein
MDDNEWQGIDFRIPTWGLLIGVFVVGFILGMIVC